MNISPTQLPDGSDITTQRPDLFPGVPVLLGGGAPNHTLQINPAAFALPPLDPAGASYGLISRFGNAPNGIIRALDSWQIDLALMKTTKITERLSAQFGVQAFNVFNHVQLGNPKTDNLAFNYVQQGSSFVLQPAGTLGLITSTVNFNNNNKASPNTGMGCRGSCNSC